MFLFSKSEPAKKKPFRILSLDGGGVRAIIQCAILKKIVGQFPDFLSEIDMFAGTSAGCIVAGALAVGVSPDKMLHLWKQEVCKIFSEGMRHRFGTAVDTIGASYSTIELEKMLFEMIGEKTLKDLKPKFLSPSFKLQAESEETNPRWHPVFYHNFSHSENANTRLVDVVLRTAAAPTYFPIKDGFVDGGTFANNPALAAVTTAIASGIPADQISVLSISTGVNPRFISKEKIGGGDWGLFEWGPWLIDLLLDSTTQSIDYECKCLLKDKYRRLDPIIHFDVGLDDASAVPELIKIADAVDLAQSFDWIENNWMIERAPILLPLELDPPPSSGWGCSLM